MEYKELIEKEAEKLMTEYFGEVNTQTRHECKGFWQLGINSELNAKIIEIQKRKYAVIVLKEINIPTDTNSKIEKDIDSRIFELEQEIANLEKEIKLTND